MLSNQEKIATRAWVFVAFVLIAFAGLAVRLYHLQINRHAELLTKAEEKTTQTIRLSSMRGEIYANNGVKLVVNQPTVNVIVDPSLFMEKSVKAPSGQEKAPEYQLSQREQAAQVIASALQMDYTDLHERFAPTRPRKNSAGETVTDLEGNPVMRSNKYVMVKRNVSLADAAKIREGAKKFKLRAITLEDTYIRFYPNGRMLASLLGYTDMVEDRQKATTGLEKSADAAIRGSDGKTQREVSRDGKLLYYGSFQETTVKDGQNIYLTIDPVIQAIMEEELDKAMIDLKNPRAIYALMVDPATGNIIAAAQRPTFDPNDRLTMANGLTSFRIGTDTLEPGSIIKPLTYAKAIDMGLITAESIEDTGKGFWIYRGRRVVDTHLGLGKIPMKEALRVSSNIVPAKIAVNLLGDQVMYENLRAFGFGKKTNLPIIAESRGVMPHYSRWDKQTGCSLGFGYALNVTPLQVVRAWCALANGGTLPELRLIDRVEDPATGKITSLAINPGQKMFKNPNTSAIISEMLAAVTTQGGTGERAGIKGYKVAGKTGTSHKYDPETRKYSNTKYFGSFIGFAPANAPRFVLLVTVDEPPRGLRYGSSSAGPVFKAISEKTLKFWQIPPTEEKKTP